MIKWPFRTYTHFMHYTRFENSSIILPKKKTCDQPQWFKRNVGLFQFLVLLLLFSLCSLYRAIWAKYLERREKKMLMKVHTLRQFIDSESDKTERRAFYFHSKTKCTYHFNICFSSPYFGGIQHFILHKKKPFEKSAILIGTVWNVRVVVIPAKWSLWKIFLGKKLLDMKQSCNFLTY